MNKKIWIALTLLLILGIFGWWWAGDQGGQEVQVEVTQEEQVTASVEPETVQPSDEEAELTGFGFMQDFAQAGPPEPDMEAVRRAYERLSKSARERVSQDAISRDLAMMVGVQDIPDQGMSVEDLQVSKGEARLMVGLNFSGGRVLREVVMVVEEGEWRVDQVNVVEEEM